MSSNRHNHTTSLPASLPALIAIAIVAYFLAQGTPDRAHDFLERVHDWLDDFVQGHILPLYADDGTGGHKVKQE
jgi:hypothetical protein